MEVDKEEQALMPVAWFPMLQAEQHYNRVMVNA